jgi:hypothetical protein
LVKTPMTGFKWQNHLKKTHGTGSPGRLHNQKD